MASVALGALLLLSSAPAAATSLRRAAALPGAATLPPPVSPGRPARRPLGAPAFGRGLEIVDE